MPTLDQKGFELAQAARKNACCEYSGFAVGACLRTKQGKPYTGCNVENASYGLTVCAERVALWKALSEGERAFDSITIVTDAKVLTPPCGPCRQLLWEYAGDIHIHLANLSGQSKMMKLSELFPNPFDSKNFHPTT